MFGFIGNYFKNKQNKNSTQTPSVSTRPANSQQKVTIRYNPQLIESLEADHARLVTLFGRIWSEGFEAKNYTKTAALIGEFKSDFQAHLLTENVKFYVYLEQTLAHDAHNLALVKEFRTDMNDIANAVVRFCKNYQGKFGAEQIAQFPQDYSGVGEVLTRRVSLEENSLYVLYQPH